VTRTAPSVHVPAAVERVLARLEKANYEAYVVGGKVRDAVLGVESRGA